MSRPRPLAVLTNQELIARVLGAFTHPFEYTRGDPNCPGCQAEEALREIVMRWGETMPRP